MQFVLQQTPLRMLASWALGYNSACSLLGTMQNCKGSGNGLGSDPLAEAKNPSHALCTLALGLRAQEQQRCWRRPRSAPLLCCCAAGSASASGGSCPRALKGCSVFCRRRRSQDRS